MALGFLYLVAIVDWASRAVLAWRLSNRWMRLLHRGARRTLARHGRRKYLNTVRARSSPAPLHRQARGAGIAISMDCRGRYHGQHFHRATVALDQIRGSASEKPMLTSERGRHRIMDEFFTIIAARIRR